MTDLLRGYSYICCCRVQSDARRMRWATAIRGNGGQGMGSCRRQVRPMTPVATPDSTISGLSAWAGDRLAEQMRREEGSRGPRECWGIYRHWKYIGVPGKYRGERPQLPSRMGAGENCLSIQLPR